MNITRKQPEADCLERYRFACKIAQGKSVLDIACGSGYSTSLFIDVGIRSYDGVDINEKQVTYANHRYASHAYSAEKVNYHVGDICSFNNGKTFDIITCFGTIAHIKNYEPKSTKILFSGLSRQHVSLMSKHNSRRCGSHRDKSSLQAPRLQSD